MKMPRIMFPHKVVLVRRRGEGAYGPVYDSPVVLEDALIDDQRRLVRNSNGDEVVSETTVFFRETHHNITPESRMEVRGRSHQVVAVSVHEAGRQFPESMEVNLR